MQIQKHAACRERRPNRSQKQNLQYSKVVFNSCALCIQQHRECQQGVFINIGLRVQCAPIMIGLSWEKAHTHKRLNPREITPILLLFHQLNTTRDTRELLWCIIDKQVTLPTMPEISSTIEGFISKLCQVGKGRKNAAQTHTTKSDYQCCSAIQTSGTGKNREMLLL